MNACSFIADEPIKQRKGLLLVKSIELVHMNPDVFKLVQVHLANSTPMFHSAPLYVSEVLVDIDQEAEWWKLRAFYNIRRWSFDYHFAFKYDVEEIARVTILTYSFIFI